MIAWSVINKGIGHWQPSELWSMSLDELEDWYFIAVENINAENEAIEKANRR